MKFKEGDLVTCGKSGIWRVVHINNDGSPMIKQVADAQGYSTKTSKAISCKDCKPAWMLLERISKLIKKWTNNDSNGQDN
jgi:hypothetical protein